MNRAEWHAYIDSAPLTPDQRGAVMRECGRLGLGDRAERLAACAALLGLGELESTADLTMGEAGKLLSVLLRTRDRAELPAAAAFIADEHQGDGPGPAVRMTLAEGVALALVILIARSTAATGTEETS